MVIDSTTDFLYQQIADRLERLIEESVYQIGDRLPSVRRLSEEQGISLGTAYKAYYHLESKGLIEARPKSGYYVRFHPRHTPALPGAVEAPPPRPVSVADMVAEVYQDMNAEEVVDFAIAAPALELLPAAKLNKSMLHAMRCAPHHGLHYENCQGSAELRRQIARLTFHWGGACREEDIVVTAGCMEAIVLCLRAVTRPGDMVAVERPTYFGIFQAVEQLGLNVVEIPNNPVDGLDLEALETALARFPIRACLFIPNFNNPLGSCLPDEKKRRLVELLAERGVPLIEDDLYGDLYFGDQRPRTCKTYDGAGLVLHCSSLSKSLAPGYRIGWAMPGRFMREVLQLKLVNSVSTQSLTQHALAHFLEVGRYEHHLRRLRRALYAQCLRYSRAIGEYFPPGTRVSRPAGGFVLWIELPPGVDGYALYRQARRHRIAIAPGQIFSADGAYQHYIRISYGRPWDAATERGIRELGRLID
jgi:DNA-binding transcriptional MocR family regulator